MTLRAFRRIAVIVLGALVLAHCARNPVGEDRGSVPLSEQQALQMGAQAQEDVLKAYAVLDDPALQAYVNEVGQRLARQSRRPDLPWHFTVVDSPDVNAFSLPGGDVYITRGLLAYLNSEAELASVVGHEIGHVVARHGLRLQGAVTASDAGPGSVLRPEADHPADAAWLQTLARTRTAGYGRERELEADRLGAEYLARTGYNPQAMIETIGILKNQAQFSAEQAIRNRQPPRATYHGIVDMQAGNDDALRREVAQATPYLTASPREGRADYLQKIAGLVFGDSPDQGVVRNNALLHQKLGLTLQFPAGWRVQNRPDRVVATSPDGGALVELEQGPKNDHPLETLQRGVRLDTGARYDSGHLGGYPAAFAAGAQQGRPVVVAVVVFNGTQYLIAGMTRDASTYERERGALRAAINSFHAITPAETLAAKPRALQLITARPGLTMAALARQSPLEGDDAEGQLRLLNALYPDGEPTTGRLLKIVQ